MLIKRLVIFALLGVILLSCAAPYSIVNPQRMSFSNYKTGNGLDYAMRGNVLSDAGNTRYAKKEMKTGLRVVAVEIENKTDKPIVLRENAKFYSGIKNIYPVEAEQISHQLKQPAGLYMLWSLLWVVIYKCESTDCSVVPLPVGFFIGLGNMSRAKKANKALLDELNANNILDKKIMPGEKARGLLGFASKILMLFVSKSIRSHLKNQVTVSLSQLKAIGGSEIRFRQACLPTRQAQPGMCLIFEMASGY